MIEFKNNDLEAYLNGLAMPGDDILAEMESFAAQRQFPIVGPQVGRLLYIFTRSTGARNIFEIGSGFGYSALWFARALPPGGKITCSEFDPANIKLAKDYFRKAQLSSRVRFVQDDGISVLGRSRKKYDIIFNDGEKKRYPEVLELSLRKLRKNGLLISDNVLWSGKVTRPDNDESTERIREYNERIFKEPSFRSVIVPVRDGISISIKL
jgi:caffeoyl-CoA O-methyltransferase